MRSAKDDIDKCPACGADVAKGCEAPNRCIEILSRMTQAWENHPLELVTDDHDDRSFGLLMATFDALDLMNIGLAVTNPTGHLLIANCNAEQVLAAGKGLEITADGEIRFSRDNHISFQQLLKQLDADTCLSPSANRPAVRVAVQRPFGKRPITAIVQSVKGIPSSSPLVRPRALVLFLDPELFVDSTEVELGQLYGFTATESRLANLMMNGWSLEDCCRELGIRITTVRMHVRNLFQKTGVHKQSQLVALLLKSIGLASAAVTGVRTRACMSSAGTTSPPQLSRSATRILEGMAGNSPGPFCDLPPLCLEV